MKKNPVLYKSLVVGVIVMFVGIGIQPAFAFTYDISDNEDDCNLCPKLSKIQRTKLKSLIDRLNILYEEFFLKLKDNPKIGDIYQEFSYRILEHKQNKENGRESICNLLWIHIYNLAIKDVFFTNLGDDLLYTNPILGLISYSLAYMYYFRILIIGAFGFIIGCLDYWFEYY